MSEANTVPPPPPPPQATVAATAAATPKEELEKAATTATESTIAETAATTVAGGGDDYLRERSEIATVPATGQNDTQIIIQPADVVSALSPRIKEQWKLDKHPGNVYLRRLIQQYALEYMKIKVDQRHRITKKVLNAISKTGGRFLKVVEQQIIECDERSASGRITKLLRKRGLELLTQEERGRNKKKKKATTSVTSKKKASSASSPPPAATTSSTKNEKKKKKKRPAPPSPSPIVVDVTDSIRNYMSPKRVKTAINDVDSPLSTSKNNSNSISNWMSPSLGGGDGGGGSSRLVGTSLEFDNHNDSDDDDNDDDNDDDDSTMWQSFEQNSERIETEVSWNAQYIRLTQFYNKNGHTGVPNNWKDDPDLADWVTRQRQLFREIQSGYRIATLREEGRWKRLQTLDFPLDYDDWHWQRKYNQVRITFC
jgi:hypothetical protein